MGISIFEREIKRFLESQCCLVIHQADLRGSRFTIRKTVDYVCCHDGVFWAIEVKQTKTNLFAFARIREHQRETLSKVANTTNGQAFLALNFRGTKQPGHAWLIPWGQWLALEENWTRKSIRRSEARDQFWRFELVRTKGGWYMPNVHGPRFKLT